MHSTAVRLVISQFCNCSHSICLTLRLSARCCASIPLHQSSSWQQAAALGEGFGWRCSKAVAISLMVCYSALLLLPAAATQCCGAAVFAFRPCYQQLATCKLSRLPHDVVLGCVWLHVLGICILVCFAPLRVVAVVIIAILPCLWFLVCLFSVYLNIFVVFHATKTALLMCRHQGVQSEMHQFKWHACAGEPVLTLHTLFDVAVLTVLTVLAVLPVLAVLTVLTVLNLLT